MQHKVFYIPCSCNSINHVVGLHVFHENSTKPYDRDINIQFMVYPKGIKEKLKALWYILTGKEYLMTDSMWQDEQVEVLREALAYYDKRVIKEGEEIIPITE